MKILWSHIKASRHRCLLPLAVLAVFAFVVPSFAVAGNKANPDAVELVPLPVPVDFKSNMDEPVPFDSTTTVKVCCPDAAALEWLSRHFGEWYGNLAPKVAGDSQMPVPGTDGQERIPRGDESYAVTADSSGVKISARSLAGVRWAAYTLRQLAVEKRGTFKTEGHILPTLSISDGPRLAFRAVHLCWFPETRPQQMERAIRLAAMLKFNYAIIETWGMYQSEKHPWWHWPNPTLTKDEVRRLASIGRDLGITLIPQINCFGHASLAGGDSVKHAVLDLHPEYGPLFEPGGWNWCLSNPETQRVLRELIAEMHEDFGNPPFFHLGCDEAQPPSCPECRKTPYAELVCRHIAGLSEFVKSRGAQAMIWGDMLLKRGDPRWKGYITWGTEATATLADTLPKDIVVCDWQYWENERKDWPTMAYFKEKGFPVAGCPWTNYKEMKTIADFIAENGGFGFIATTWNKLRGTDWRLIYRNASAAAWGTDVPDRAPMTDIAFGTALRLVGHDMKIADYLDTGNISRRVPPS